MKDGKIKIDEHHINRRGLRNMQTLLAIFRFSNVIASLLQDQRQERAIIGIVLD
jgi:hypothetical protein